ncbi:MAG TPA: hypothetical protein VGG79_11585 [Roseiarcus sp.]
MARSARKPGGEADESAKQASTKPDETTSTAAAGSDGTAPEAAGPTKPRREFADFQSDQFELLRTLLEKRSEENASPRAIIEEFAALWLPIQAVDLELLVPALREAEAAESQSYAARVRKDLLNIILADLISNNDSHDVSGAKLEALSDAFAAYQKAAEQERERLGEKEGDLGRRMKNRFDRLKGRFSDLNELGEAMDLLAPRSLSVSASRRRSRRENDMPRYSSNTPERDDQGRFTSDNDRGSSRGGGGVDRDDSGRFASEGRSSRNRYDDDDSRSRGRDESGHFASEGRSSRSRHDDDDNRSRDRDESGRFASERGRDDNDDRSRGHDESGRFMSERNRRYDEDTRSRGRGRDDDRDSDRRSASRSRDDDDRSRGWFGDSEGHSEASRRGWERSDHGDSGWYGDREGHSDASRRGWERSDHGDSGWYGDREGHSEAARRGWEDGH